MDRIKSLAIISVMEGYPWGGSEELWYETAKAAINKGIKISISYKKWDRPPKKIVELENLGATIYFRNNTRVYPSLAKRIIGKLTASLPAIKSINQFMPILQTRPDKILISEGGFLNVLYNPDLYEELLNCRIPYSIIVEQNKEYGSIDKDFLEVARTFYGRSHDIFFVSHRNKEVAEMMVCSDLDNAKVVRNPVNLKSVEIVPWVNSQILRLASIGRLHCQSKGNDILLRALAQLKNEFDFELTFYGSGKDENYLKELTDYLKLNDCVKFGGFENSIQNIWSKNQMLVMASHYEGIPLVVVEAMLCGRPCILTDVAGNSEWINHGKNGFIADSSTVMDMKKTLKMAFQKKNEWEDMGIEAFKAAKHLYDSNPGTTLLNLICY